MWKYNGGMLSLLFDSLVRPTMTTGLAWSSALHAGILVAAVMWLPAPMDRASIGGQNNTIHVEIVDVADWPVEKTQFANIEPGPITLADAFKQSESNIAPRELEFVSMNDTYSVSRQADRRVNTDVKPSASEVAHATRSRHEARPTAPPPTALTVPQVAGVDDKTPPNFSGNPPPVYPAEAIRNRLEGIVNLRLFIAKTGRVLRVEIVESSGYSILDRSAINSVRTWHGVPAYMNGNPVESVEVLPVRFQLNARR